MVKLRVNRESEEPLSIRLVNLSVGFYEEYYPMMPTKRVKDISQLADSTLQKVVKQKIEDARLPLVLRKKKLYEQYLDKNHSQKIIADLSEEPNIMDCVSKISESVNVPIIMRKRLLYKKVAS